MNIDIPELAQVLDGLSDLRASVTALGQFVTEPRFDQEWYSLRQAARLKRGIEHRQDEDGTIREQESFLSTLRARPALQPGGGKPEGHIGGVAVWHRKTILEWLLQRDEELEPQRAKKEAKAKA